MLLKQHTYNKKPIFGIGINLTKTFNQNFGFNKNIILAKLKYKQKNNLNSFIKKLPLGRKLKDNTSSFLNFMYKIKTYKGLRHKLKYPCRGQRTHTNAKTKKKFNY